MRELPVLGEFDLVCALNDAVNYVLDEAQLVETFSGFRRNLAPGGVVLFDVNTIGTFRRFGALVRQEPGRVLVVEGHGERRLPARGAAALGLRRPRAARRLRLALHRSSHFQRHHPDAEVRRALGAAGLELVGVHGQDHLTLADTLDEFSDEKAVYVARVPHAHEGGGE